MGANTAIEWARHTFNPWYGCQPVSPACDHCYAEAWAKRSGLVGWGPHVERRRSSNATWREPLKWNAAAEALSETHTVFGPSLGDPFDNKVPVEWRADYFTLIRKTPSLLYLLLTKRPQNIVAMVEQVGGLPANIALGTTAEDQERADQNVPPLLAAKAKLNPRFAFVSAEPLLGPMDFTCIPWPHDHKRFPDSDDISDAFDALRHTSGGHIDWIIVGGESGSGARPMHPDWARKIRDDCQAAGTAFFFKQWGEWLPGEANRGQFDSKPMHAYRRVDIHTYEWPAHSRVENFGTHPDRWSGDLTTRRVGKKAAGRLLDGVEHNGMPR